MPPIASAPAPRTNAASPAASVPWRSALELGGLLVCGGLLCALGVRVLPLVGHAAAWPAVVVVALAAYVAADLAAGAVHWFCDTFFAEDTPLIGRAIIEPFREHHRDPLAITRRGFVSVNGSNGFALIPVLALAGRGEPSLGHAFLLVFGLALCLTNQLHKWAHAARVPRLARWLQRARLILPADHHARHHRHGGTRTFCVTNGWCNPLLDRLEVFARLERRVRRP